ncbi:porin family protein [Prevotella sp. RM4]|uniref:porin family protein n=1 Tax=Prevotella sp. RM4 TaxID=1200547 RepID=UPI00051C8F7E|nr:porin family protein [Prevotella sp. RM4]
MKKFFTLVVLLATMTVAAQAQVKFGVKGGLNLTNMKFDNSAFDKSNQTGFFIGPTLNFTLPVIGLGIDASALYDQRSAEVNDEKLKQQSIQIPINLRYGFGLGNTASIYIFAGPQFGFNVGDKKTNLLNEALDWRMKDSSLSANVGLGLMLLNHLQVSANYNIAMGTTGEFDILKDVPDAAWKQVTGKTKANAWQLSVAYFF